MDASNPTEAIVDTPADRPTIYFDGSVIRLTLPPSGGCGQGRSHTIVISNWRQLERILRARFLAEHRSSRVIGTRASPVQYDLERITHLTRKSGSSLTMEEFLELFAGEKHNG